MLVEEPIRVHSYDIDLMRIVHNSVYVKWFEDLRMAILDKYFPLKEMLAVNCSPILAETTVRYLRPVTLESKVTGRAWISELTKSHWVATLEIFDENQKVAEGKQMGYYFDMGKNRPVRFPSDFVQFYENL